MSLASPLRVLQPCWLLFALLLLLVPFTGARATHLKGGNITAMQDTTANPNPLRYFFKMVIYTDRSSQAEDLRVDINMGDGRIITIPRGPVRQVSPETDQEVFAWEFTFPAPGTYTIGWLGVNRNGRILNLQAPADAHSFYLSTTITINPLRGPSSTPVLRYPPTDVAIVGRKFVHNPAAFDRDGDSLSFKLISPRRQAANSTNIIPVPGYTLPHTLFNCANAGGAGPATFTLDPVTGQMEWDAPCRQGEYVVAFAVEEWRKTALGTVKVGEVVRDMQITVREGPNRPPVLSPKDTCIVAGTTLNWLVTATDPDGDRMQLAASGSLSPAASFTPRPGNATSPGIAYGDFTWATTCADVREQPYQVVFRAEDIKQAVGERLAALQPWRIRVVAPAPQNLAASRQGSNMQLTWSNYACEGASAMLVYRRDGSSTTTSDDCTPGVPAGSGYVKIGEVSKDVTSFLDANGAAGVSPLRKTCYKIVAVFPYPKGGQSTSSAEVCAAPGKISFDKEAVDQLVKIHPNPVRGRLHLSMLNKRDWQSLRIYSTTGQLLLEVQGNGESSITLDLPKLPTGFHLIKVQTDKEIITKRVLLE